MAERYRLSLFNRNGEGTITRNPYPDGRLYDVGAMIELSVVPVPGYTFQSWQIGTNIISLTPTFTFEMPNQDVAIFVVYEEAYVTPYSYGLKYFATYCTKGGTKTTRVEIEEKNYVGSATEVGINNVMFRFGNDNGNIRETVIGSSLDFTLPVLSQGDYSEFLTLDIRMFRVKYYRGYVSAGVYDFIWTGYLTTDVYEEPDLPTPYPLDLTATDGIKTLSMPIDINRAVNLRGSKLLSSFLNQTFLDPLPISEVINFYETRMIDTDSVLNQFEINDQRLFKDDNLYLYDKNGILANPRISIREGIERLLRPFVARVFQWNGKWRVIRLDQYSEDSFNQYELDNTGDPVSSAIIDNTTQVLDGCLFENTSSIGDVGYSELTASLKLGNIEVPEKNQLVNEDFEYASWEYYADPTSGSGFRPIFRLKRWDYIKCTVFDGERASETARVEWVADQYGYSGITTCMIWGTANGVADANMSYLEFNAESKIIGAPVAVENANTVSVGCKFLIHRRSSDDPATPPAGTHVAGIAVQLGDNYLYETVTPNVYDWTTTPTIVTFPCNNSGVFNTVDIPNVLVPEDGDITFRLYQLITLSGGRHKYAILWDDASVVLEKNPGLTNQELVGKAVTDVEYPSVAPDYELHIGDAFTTMSASAIILSDVLDKPVSEFWTRDGVESLDMLEIILQDLANLQGKNNFRIRGTYHGSIEPIKAVIINSEKFFVNSFILDDWNNSYQIDFYKL